MELTISKNDGFYYFITYDKKPVRIEICREEETHFLGNIYVGRVSNIVKNMELAFVSISPETTVCVQLSDAKKPVIYNENGETRTVLRTGDTVLVQVNSESVGEKKLKAACDIRLSGKYTAVTSGYKSFAVSSRIKDDAERKRLRKLAGILSDEALGKKGLDTTVIMRTEAEGADEDIIRNDFEEIIERLEDIVKKGRNLTLYSLVCGNPKEKDHLIEQYLNERFDTVITDDDKIKKVFEDRFNTVLHTAEEMNALYNARSVIKKALEKKVWLPGGGNIVIEQTESLVSIDVNSTGDVLGKKNKEETALKVNLEAAAEIARQLKLKDLSGIIIVDFINMKKEESYEILKDRLKEELRKDKIRTEFVDFTSLKLAQIIRKRVRIPLAERVILKNIKQEKK